MMRNIALIGFMGAGKSYYARVIGKEAGFAVVDTDLTIRRNEKMEIAEIFASRGEAYFRQKERELLERVKDKRRTVLSLGGGTILTPGNAEIIKPTYAVIFLDTPFTVCLERVRRNDRRPLAASSTDEELLLLYEKRRQLYQNCCDLRVDTPLSEREVLNEILRYVRKQK